MSETVGERRPVVSSRGAFASGVVKLTVEEVPISRIVGAASEVVALRGGVRAGSWDHGVVKTCFIRLAFHAVSLERTSAYLPHRPLLASQTRCASAHTLVARQFSHLVPSLTTPYH